MHKLLAAVVVSLCCSCVFTQELSDEEPDWITELIGHLRVPSEFRIEAFAEIPSVRTLAVSPSGTVYATHGRGSAGIVYACRDSDFDGVATSEGECWPVTGPNNEPNGIAFLEGNLYVALIDQVLMIRDVETDPTTIKEPEQILGPESFEGAGDGLPTYTHHGWRYIAVDAVNRRLAVAVGAPCNVPGMGSGGINDCANQGGNYPLVATIAEFNVDGSGLQVVARGVRNSVGITYHPDTNEMWFTENGRDQWGSSGSVPTVDTSEFPPDELNRLGSTPDWRKQLTDKRPLPDYGFPACYGKQLVDDADDAEGQPFNPEGDCGAASGYIGAVANLPSHSAALGVRFYNETNFPVRYYNRAFIAEHGSWNRWPPSGYTVSCVDVGDAATATATSRIDTPDSYEEFLSGFRLVPDRPCSTSADCPGNSTCQLGAPNFGPTRLCGMSPPSPLRTHLLEFSLVHDPRPEQSHSTHGTWVTGAPVVSGAGAVLAGLPVGCGNAGGRGRPVDVEVLRDGSMLVSDDMNSLVYRISFIGEEKVVVEADASGAAVPSHHIGWHWPLGCLLATLAIVGVLMSVCSFSSGEKQDALRGSSHRGKEMKEIQEKLVL
jgi:glucose/arabinose dehydrogenase